MKIHLLVGSGGGVPSSNPPDDPDENIRLGDIVVGWSGKTGTPGVVQWDFVRYLNGRRDRAAELVRQAGPSTTECSRDHVEKS